MATLVIVPTYNESENIENLVRAVFALGKDLHILVVDDSSPDGTGEIVQGLTASFPGLHLLSRPAKQGLGRAYLAGFAWGLERDYEYFVEMDADFSHRPEDLAVIADEITQQDFVIGSRYIPGGETVNWGIGRKWISRGGGLYARWILGYNLKDWTGGFNAWSRKVLEGIELSTVQSEGYSFQIELKYRACQRDFRAKEVPIVFEDRRVGKSKMSLAIVLEAFYRVWFMRFQKWK